VCVCVDVCVCTVLTKGREVLYVCRFYSGYTQFWPTLYMTVLLCVVGITRSAQRTW
jgi:hypothetical protein